MVSFTERIAKFIGQMSYDQLDAAAVDVSKRCILDCLGVTLAGSEEEAGRSRLWKVQALSTNRSSWRSTANLKAGKSFRPM